MEYEYEDPMETESKGSSGFSWWEYINTFLPSVSTFISPSKKRRRSASPRRSRSISPPRSRQSTQRRKRYFGRRVQPIRLSKHRPKPSAVVPYYHIKFDEMDMCLAAGAYNVFSNYACVSLGKEYDIKITIDTDGSILLEKAGDGLFGPYGDYWRELCDDQRYVIIRVSIRTPTYGHASVLLWDTHTDIAEYFDAGGYEGEDSENTLAMLRLKLPIEHITVVNQKDLQILDEDVYCQTWTYFYIYLRLVEGLSLIETTTYLNNMDKKDLLAEIEGFWRFILERV